MDPFESILSIMYSEFYCVRDTQGILRILSQPLTLLLIGERFIDLLVSYSSAFVFGKFFIG